LRETQSDDYSRMVREVIDGQQRLRSVLDFIDGRFAISRSISAPWAGMRFETLPRLAQERIRHYHFSCEVFDDISDASVLDIFARMNSYSTPLNKQELRNGRFFGPFKQLSYQLSRDYLEFWRQERLFTEQAIARMLEVELVSELLILGMSGPQDKKASIDRYYSEYDDDFIYMTTARKRFQATLEEISDSVGDILPESEFRRIPLFYSLYGAVYHRLFGVQGLDLPTSKSRLKRSDKDTLVWAVEKLSSLVEAGREEEDVPKRYQAFVTACLRQTDNIQPRIRRLNTIYSEAELG